MMNWGNAIVAGFVLFAVFVFSLVYKMVTSGNDLVDQRKDKQKQQLSLKVRQSTRSGQMEKAMALSIDPATGAITIRVDTSAAPLEGEIYLTCLSRAASDEVLPLQLTKSGSWLNQAFTLKKPHPGTWLCQIQGQSGGEAFWIEKKFRL